MTGAYHAHRRAPGTDTQRGPLYLLLIVLLAFFWTHRHAVDVMGFAEDIGIVQGLSTAAASGNLFDVLWPRINGPLWGPGSTMWRPWAYASLGLDAWLFGENAGAWHGTNLLLHLATAAATATLARTWMRSAYAGVAVFATMLLHPWSAEITFWLVGRFDGWASAAIMCALLAGWHSQGWDRYLALSGLFAGIAYASKESALILPAATGTLALAQAYEALQTARHMGDNAQSLAGWRAARDTASSTLRDTLSERGALIVMHILLAITYLILRWQIVGTASTNVYSSVSISTAHDLWSRLLNHASAFVSTGSVAPIPAGIAAALYVVGLSSVVFFQRSWAVLAWSGFWVSLVLLGAVLHFPTAPGWGDGFRIYYLGLVGLAMAAAPSVADTNRNFNFVILLAWVAALSMWQNQVNRQWWLASTEMRLTVQAIAAEVPRMADADYGLILLPDPINFVPTFRNAQGAIITEAARVSVPPMDPLSHLIAFVPVQMNEWRGLMSQPVVAMITKRANAPAQPTRYYCKEPGKGDLQYLGFWLPGSSETWHARWSQALRDTCPSLLKILERQRASSLKL